MDAIMWIVKFLIALLSVFGFFVLLIATKISSDSLERADGLHNNKKQKLTNNNE